jgi:hypothetical protein
MEFESTEESSKETGDDECLGERLEENASENEVIILDAEWQSQVYETNERRPWECSIVMS